MEEVKAEEKKELTPQEKFDGLAKYIKDVLDIGEWVFCGSSEQKKAVWVFSKTEQPLHVTLGHIELLRIKYKDVAANVFKRPADIEKTMETIINSEAMKKFHHENCEGDVVKPEPPERGGQ